MTGDPVHLLGARPWFLISQTLDSVLREGWKMFAQ
jgi:hypothetical protein